MTFSRGYRHIPKLLALLGPVFLACTAHSAIISDFRLRGPNGANDEFIRIYNDTAADVTVSDTDGGSGWSIAASNGVVRCTIPNGTVLPAGGSFLCANSVAYSLSGLPGGAANATYTLDIPDNAGIALFSTTTTASFSPVNRMDAVGSTSEANSLYKEGTGYPALTPFSIDYGFTRDRCGKKGAINDNTPCTPAGTPVDTNNNASDFVFVDTNGTSAGAGQRLGAPGPANLTAPIQGTAITHARLDTCAVASAGPNFVREYTSDPANNAHFGTAELRRTFTNTTGTPLTKLRFRIIDLTTFPAPSGFADLRPRTSTNVVVAVANPACDNSTSNVTVVGTQLEQPPSQLNGGGFNSTLAVPSITPATPLAAGATVSVRFLLGIQQTGSIRFAVAIEGDPVGGEIYEFQGCNAGPCSPKVSSIVRATPSPTNAGQVSFTVTFDQAVTGVDTTDFVLAASGVSGAAITGVTGSGTTYTVTATTGTGDGSLGLNLVDDDSIKNTSNESLAGSSTANGNFTGQTYVIDKTGPSVTVNQASGQTDPTSTGPINFTVTFSAPVTGFGSAQVSLGGTAQPAVATVSGGPTVYNVAVSGMTANGTVTASILPGAVDSLGNANAASTSTDNTVAFTGIPVVAPVMTPPSGALPSARAGTAFSRTISTTAGTAPFTYAVTAGSLPAGVSLNPASGVISGTPTGAGTSNFTVTVTGNDGGTASESYSIVIAAAATNVAPVPTLSEWGVIALSALLALFGIARTRRQD